MTELYIACGFRCFCIEEIKSRFKVNQPSLPFDFGLFTTKSIIKFLEKEELNINITNTAPCIKTENFHNNNMLGIKFEKSSYDHMEDFIKKNDFDNGKLSYTRHPTKSIEMGYLDSTKGYYTLCEDYGFVLAHYNWHKSSSPEKNKGVTDPEENTKNVSSLLSRRKDRLLDMIDNSEKINLCYLNRQNYEFMQIDEDSYSLSKDLNLLKSYFQSKFLNKSFEILYL